MIPGLASSGATWDSTAAHLSGQFRCIQLTLAGFVGEPPIQAPLLTTARDQIAQYIRDNHLERPVIMGHSLGGSIALAAHVDVEIVGEARNADDAEDVLERYDPDLLFLDIQMPGRSGLEMLEGCPNPPQTILTTAFDRYAVRGFELNAVDYPLKPIAPERLFEPLRRVRERLRSRASSKDGEARTDSAAAPGVGRSGLLRQVFLRDGDRCWLVRMEEIGLLRAEGNYTRVVFGGNHPTIPRSLAQIEPRLDSTTFFRANRAEIINLRRVTSITPEADGYSIALRDGANGAVSRRQAKMLRDRLEL